jgi:hypothetical protein
VIDVRLDPGAHMLLGRQRVRWRNTSDRPTSELQFHLDFNAWRDARSSWMREQQQLVGDAAVRLLQKEPGALDVGGIRLLGSTARDLSGTARFVAPDDANADDRTVMTVPLPVAVAPGADVEMELDWRALVPRAIDGIGRIGNFYLLARWYPQLCSLQTSGWNCRQFRPSTRSSGDAAAYDVRITVPPGWIVGATGVEQEPSANADSYTHRFAQDDVPGFAWAAGVGLVAQRGRFSSPPLPAVDIEVLLQPDHAAHADRYMATAQLALERFGHWFGPYPYPRITIVDPAWQGGANRLAFPMMITAATSWRLPNDILQPEAAILDGIARQFWAVMAASDHDGWLDDGLSGFSVRRLLPELFSGVTRREGSSYYVRRYFGGFVPHAVRAVRLSGAMDSPRSSLWADTLERYIGWPAFQQMLQAYFDRWRGGHPSAADFFSVGEDVTGRDLSWFSGQVHETGRTFDYSVERLESRAESGPDGTLEYRTDVVVSRRGDGIFSGTAKEPVGPFEAGDAIQVMVTFADGRVVRERWDGRGRSKTFAYASAAQAVSAEVDPHHVLALDINAVNNSVTLAPAGPRVATRLATRWMIWLEDLLLSYGALF